MTIEDRPQGLNRSTRSIESKKRAKFADRKRKTDLNTTTSSAGGANHNRIETHDDGRFAIAHGHCSRIP